MSEIRTVDARGLSCPQPVMLARQAIDKVKEGSIEVLVDSGTARDNVSRLGKKYGWSVTLEDQTDGTCRVVLQK